MKSGIGKHEQIGLDLFQEGVIFHQAVANDAQRVGRQWSAQPCFQRRPGKKETGGLDTRVLAEPFGVGAAGVFALGLPLRLVADQVTKPGVVGHFDVQIEVGIDNQNAVLMGLDLCLLQVTGVPYQHAIRSFESLLEQIWL